MPTHRGKDKDGCFYQWGSSGKKYYYKCNDAKAREKAKALADRQGRAIEWRKHSAKGGKK